MDTLTLWRSYYRDAKIPWILTIEDKETSECETLSNESLDKESQMDRDVREAKKVIASFKKNPRARGIYQKKIFLEESVDTELDFSVSKCSQ